ncbi:MAG: SAM-dependent methyltransferase [Patescibacteria group bacterium]|nr:SAM-dependent methyltransferase [Patescibacteria group bacterium]MCL5432256.1 SAM-dependent methyltransferase [Patescibacteria group bacterium]
MTILPSSFKDPAGFMFKQNGQLFRQINPAGAADFAQFCQSGLCDELVAQKMLIPHQQIRPGVIKPQLVPFISYAYEWCFDQLKDAALLTLAIEKIALKHDMTLKDAASFNIQFLCGAPVLIDTLSFTKYVPGQPWIPYKQFCEQFLAPLALMAARDIRLGRLLRSFVGGLPLDLVASLLPVKSKLQPGILMHLVLHARSQGQARRAKISRPANFSRQSLLGLIDSLESTIESLKWDPPAGGSWADYQISAGKEKIVAGMLKIAKPKALWDIGANTGTFSRLAAGQKINVLAIDSDPAVVETNYQQIKKDKETRILPLWLDIANPSPALGWANQERDDLFSRSRPDAVLSLALIHHLAISQNLPLPRLAKFFAALSPNLIIEFVPKDDPRVRELLALRQDIFPNYNQVSFEKGFARYFKIIRRTSLPKSGRQVYLMKHR